MARDRQRARGPKPPIERPEDAKQNAVSRYPLIKSQASTP